MIFHNLKKEPPEWETLDGSATYEKHLPKM